jgi:hypothetical protein
MGRNEEYSLLLLLVATGAVFRAGFDGPALGLVDFLALTCLGMVAMSCARDGGEG